jgi:hypothetical protein
MERKNRDAELMEGIFDLMNETVSVEKRSEWTYERMFSITRKMTGMPGGGGNAPGMDGMLAEVEELNGFYGEKLKRCLAMLRKAERVLNGIENQRMRTFVQMVYIDRAAKGKVMKDMEMSEYMFEKCVERIEVAESMRKVKWPERE